MGDSASPSCIVSASHIIIVISRPLQPLSSLHTRLQSSTPHHFSYNYILRRKCVTTAAALGTVISGCRNARRCLHSRKLPSGHDVIQQGMQAQCRVSPCRLPKPSPVHWAGVGLNLVEVVWPQSIAPGGGGRVGAGS